MIIAMMMKEQKIELLITLSKKLCYNHQGKEGVRNVNNHNRNVNHLPCCIRRRKYLVH